MTSYYSDGGLNPTIPVTLKLDNNRLLISGSDGLLIASWRCSSLSVEENQPYWLIKSRQDLGQVTTDHAQIVTTLKLSRRRSKRIKVTAIASAAVLSLTIGITWGIPQFTRNVFASAPAEWHAKLGGKISKDILERNQICQGESGNQILEHIAFSMAKAMPVHAKNIAIYVLDSPRLATFAAMNGHVFIHRGLIDQMRSAPEIIGMVAHELGHMALGHAMQTVSQAYKISSFWGVLSSESSRLITHGADIAAHISYTPHQELAANVWALEQMKRLKWSSHGYFEFLTRLQHQHGTDYQIMHTDIQRQAQMFENAEWFRALETPEALNALQRICD